MTREEKQLLIQDLCGRLPYVVKCNAILKQIDGSLKSIFGTFKGYNGWATVGNNLVDIETVMPYLRPMSSMTEEELDELLDCEDIDFDGKSELVKRAMLAFAEGDKLLSNALFSMQYAKTVDWLNAHHFDYRGLIEKGLALEAPKDMYITKIK